MFEKGTLVNSLVHYPAGMVFFTTPELMEIGNLPFVSPHDKPTLKAVAGNGQVTLSWDSRSERSYDPFLREFDFEGYMLYRSTEPNFQERLLVTDAYGNPVSQRPRAQFDLQNGIRGLHPVPVNGVQFNLGTDTGLRHSYIDRDVVNGQTYYYALVAYDRGLVVRNPDGSLPSAPDGQVDGLSPSITTAVINSNLAGDVVTDQNTAVVTPRAPAAGYVPPGVATLDDATRGTGAVDISIVSPTGLSSEARYELRFTNPAPWSTDPRPSFALVNEYLPGQGIALHLDYQPFDRTVASLSLLSPCVMEFRHAQDDC